MRSPRRREDAPRIGHVGDGLADGAPHGRRPRRELQLEGRGSDDPSAEKMGTEETEEGGAEETDETDWQS